MVADYTQKLRTRSKKDKAIVSEYIKKAVRGRPFKENYISALERLARLIIEGPCNVMDGWSLGRTKDEHEHDYRQLLKALRPKRYAQDKRDEERELREVAAFEKREKAEERKTLAAEKKLWAKMSGKA